MKMVGIPKLAVLTAALLLGLGSSVALSDTGGDETLRLHLGSDGTQFVYSNSGDPVTQAITASSNCKAAVTGPLAAISGSDQGPGLKDGSIGIKTGGSQGVPCARVDSTEDLTVSLVGVPDAVKVSLDLELKGDVKANVVLKNGSSTVGTYQVRAGGGIVSGEGVDGTTSVPFSLALTGAQATGNCRNASDSGPDSGPNDNCRVTLTPTASFDSLKIAPVSGEVSLEGSWDFGNNPAHDTVFTLGESYDGEIGCTEVDNTATIEAGTVFGEINRLQNTDGSDCVLKPYNLDADTAAQTLSFVPFDNPGAPQPAAYQATLKFAPELAANPFTSQLEYDQDDDGTTFDWEVMPWCTGDPFASPDAPGSINTAVIPGGHTWCIVGSSTAIASPTEIRTTWSVVGIGDPKFR